MLKYHPAWQGRVKLDVHAQRVTVTDPPWHESNRPAVADQIREWTDADSVRLSSWIRREVFALDLTVSDVDRAVGVAAEADTYHPFRDYLDGLVWDQTPRLSSWLTTYLGVEPTDYSALVGRWWMVAAVARTYDPGCKVDNVLILEGAQGIKKSAALRTLASPRWFTDTPIDIGSKDAYLALQGRVIVELAELDSLKRADADRAKTFFSSPVDVYRPPYARRNISVPRGCVFAGTVNHAQYLQDDTGNRRYWPVRCSRVDLEALGLDRSQLWAEAVWLYREGFRWWPDSPAEAMLCEVEQAPRGESDAWEDIVSRWVDGHPDTSTADILGGPLKIETGKWSKADQQRVGRVLVGLGLERYRRRDGESLTWRYRVDKQRKQRNSSQG